MYTQKVWENLNVQIIVKDTFNKYSRRKSQVGILKGPKSGAKRKESSDHSGDSRNVY